MPIEIKYVPKQCKDHEVENPEQPGVMIPVKATFSGHIVCRGTTFDERMEQMEQLGIEADAKGEVSTQKFNAAAMVRKLVKKAQEYIVRVELKRLSDNKEFKSFEDLSEDGDCDDLITDFGYAFRKGFKPGKA